MATRTTVPSASRRALPFVAGAAFLALLLVMVPAWSQDTTGTQQQAPADTLEPETITPDTTDDGPNRLLNPLEYDQADEDQGANRLLNPLEDDQAEPDADTTAQAVSDTAGVDTTMGGDPESVFKLGGGQTQSPLGRQDMVRIEAGRLPDPMRRFVGEDEKMGWTDGFLIDKHEVTNAQFARFLSADPGHSIYFDERMWITETEEGEYVPDEGKSALPVVFVNWFGAYAFATWAGKSLPTEEEWVLAAMGSFQDEDLTQFYPWGPAQDTLSVRANLLNINQIGRPDSVGSWPSSDTPTGLSDMGGNVAEWTLSNFTAKKQDASEFERQTMQDVDTDMPVLDEAGASPADSTLRFVIKGGSYLDPPANTQLNRRATRFPHGRYQYVGFRTIQRLGPQ